MLASTVITLHIRCTDQARAVQKLGDLKRSGAVASPVHGKWISVFDPGSLYDDEELQKLAAQLSSALESPAMIVSLIKYNQLGIDLFVNAEHSIQYLLDLDPARGKPSPENCDRAAEGVASKLLPLCRAGTDIGHLDRLLRALEVTSGHMERNPVDNPQMADYLEARLPELLAMPINEMSRDSALRMVRAGHATTRRDFNTFMARSNSEFLETLGRLRDYSKSAAAEALGKGDESRARKEEKHYEDLSRWIASGAIEARVGIREMLDRLEGTTEAEAQEMIDFNHRAQMRWRGRARAHPAALRDAAAQWAKSPRSLRAAYVVDVWHDLCELLELDRRFTTEDEPHACPDYPVGYSAPI